MRREKKLFYIRDLRGRWFHAIEVFGNAAYFTKNKDISTPSYSEEQVYKMLDLLRNRRYKVTFQRA